MEPQIITPNHLNWPWRTRNVRNMPPQLWVKGNVGLLTEMPGAAVVGARACTIYGHTISGQIGSTLARHDYVTVSGLAYGVDAAAHRGALAWGGPTIAVMPCGLDTVYPAPHQPMAERILEAGGLLISENAPGTVPTRQHFLARNRLIASLGDSTVVVEASTRSGTLNTAGEAHMLGRPVVVVPGAITSLQSAGSNALLGEYATPLLDTDNIRQIVPNRH